MKIAAVDFVTGMGAKFTIQATTETERVLLVACLDGKVLRENDEATMFDLFLPVSN